ncbi:MAG: YkvA family protein [Salinibacter sp.]
MPADAPTRNTHLPNRLQTLGPLPSHSELTETLIEAAQRVLRRRFRVVLLIREAYAHLDTNADALTAVWDDLRTALRLLVAWGQRSYRRVSAGTLVLLVAALLYFVTPVDVMPDPLGALGFVDDIAVVQTAVEAVRTELDRFRAWED